MAATYQWSESNAAGEVVTDNISTLNFGSDDSADLTPASHPIVAGQNSFEKYIRAKFGGTFTEISNMLFWKSSGAYKTGESVKAAANQTYTQPVSSSSSKATSDIPTSQGTALAIQAADGSATIVAAGYTKYIVLQLQTTSSTPAGAVNTKTMTFQYDEV
jgi:hypothetical protein